ncbi:MAG TPA: PaaI family thioesterase [Sphingomonas sp.]|nr:PaaI family thioesterase [Sphingomonas sp.]
MTDERRNQMSGLEQVRAMLAAGRQPPFGVKLGVSLIEADYGHAIFEGVPDDSTFNPMGSVHGGYFASMLDSACGIAVHTALEPGCGYTTLELKVQFIAPLTARSGTVRAVGKLVSIGRRAAFSEASLFDGQGKLCATATSTLLILQPRS